MHPAKISEKEDRFAATMKLPSGRTFKHVGTVTIPGGFEITSIRPTDPTYYYPADTTKKSICLHFTVGYIMSDIEALSKPGNHVSVSYVVDRAGRIYAEAGSRDQAEFTLRQAYQIQATVGKCMTKEGHSLLLRLLQEKGDESAYLSVKNGEKLE